jgi:hypothetical protein
MPAVDQELNDYPFVWRKMLDFQEGASFDMRLRTNSDTTGTIIVRGATKQGPFSFAAALDGAFADQEFTFHISDIPIWVSVIDQDNVFTRGQVYTTLSLMVNGQIVHMLCAGYCYSALSPTFPATEFKETTAAHGRWLQLSSTNPAAGDELSLSITGAQRTLVRAVRFTLVTDANAANRFVHLVFTLNSGAVLNFFSSVAQTATTTRNYTCVPIGAAGAFSEDNDILIPIPPDFLIDGGTSIDTETTGKQAGDNFGVMNVIVERWIG